MADLLKTSNTCNKLIDVLYTCLKVKTAMATYMTKAVLKYQKSNLLEYFKCVDQGHFNSDIKISRKDTWLPNRKFLLKSHKTMEEVLKYRT